MSAAEKFMFDVTFDNEVEEILVHEESDGMSAVDEEPEIIVPTFSEEDLETARQTAFANCVCASECFYGKCIICSHSSTYRLRCSLER